MDGKRSIKCKFKKIKQKYLKIENLFPENIPYLIQGITNEISLNIKQIHCLIIHMFFCTFSEPKNTKLIRFPNFNHIYKLNLLSSNLSKIRCLINFFFRISSESEQKNTNLSIIRLCLEKNEFPDWENSKLLLKDSKILDEGGIEDIDDNCIQADFANKYVGGGVLHDGNVQEEIRFIISPELLVARLFMECLKDNEISYIIGTQKYCNYSGYGESFRFKSDFNDSGLKIDLFNRKDNVVLVFDAIDIYPYESQFVFGCFLRELHKAFIGFSGKHKSFAENNENKKKIVTGKWGCGVFGGDSQLKFIIQWLAASINEREMWFFRLKDPKLSDINIIIENMKNKTVGDVFNKIKVYCNEQLWKNQTIFEYLLQIYT